MARNDSTQDSKGSGVNVSKPDRKAGGTIVPIIVAIIGAIASLGVARITATNSAKPAAIEAVGAELGVLVGTIITSVVPPEELPNVDIGLKGFDPQKARWVPADGRTVAGSRYAVLYQKTTVPDLRGLFLRGLNRSEMNLVRTDMFAAPNDSGRVAGYQPQMDSLQMHSHRYEVGGGSAHHGGTFAGVEGDNTYASARILEPMTIDREKNGDVRTDVETRPKNAAVFYYIRIN